MQNGTDLNKSLHLKLSQHGAGQDMQHVQPGLSSQSQAPPSCTSACYSGVGSSDQLLIQKEEVNLPNILSPHSVLSAWFDRVEI